MSDWLKKPAWRLGVGILLVAGAVAGLWPDRREPQFEGRNISWWLEEKARDSERYEMSFAFVGQEAAPVLAAALGRKDSRWNSFACVLWQKIPSPIRCHFPAPVLNATRRRAAAFGLLQMKERAAAARPALLAALNDSDARVRELAAAALEELGLGP